MGQVFAAYELGLFTVLARYDHVYLERFAWDPDAAGAMGHAQQRLRQAVHALKREIGDQTEVELLRNAIDRLLADGAGREQTRDHFDKLETLAANALKNHPRYHNWVELGLALGHCVLEMLEEETLETLPSLKRTVAAISRLPASAVESAPILKRMASVPLDASPLTFLCDVLEVEKTEWSGWIMMCKLDRLEQRITGEIRRIPAGHELDLRVDPLHSQAILDGVAYEIDYSQAQILRVLLKCAGLLVKPGDWAQHEPQLKNVQIHKQIPKLPVAIQKLIERARGRNGGRRLALDVKPAEAEMRPKFSPI